MPGTPRECQQMVLSHLYCLIQQCQVVALDPFCCSFQQLGDKLLQHHLISVVIGITFFSQQLAMTGIPWLLSKRKSVSDRNCWRCCSGVHPTHCRTAHMKSGYSSMLVTGSCWLVSRAISPTLGAGSRLPTAVLANSTPFTQRAR